MLKPELLAPAGNLKKLQYALAFGADAVYCGLPDFSLRYRVNNFDYESLAEGMKYTHEQGKKIYVTINIFPHKKQLELLKEHIEKLKKIKPDALIVSDPGILAYIKSVWPDIDLHLSTQANCTNWRAAKFWADQGIKRIILAREATLEDIREIHHNVPEVELETFVHGAMCMAYSGRCILSKWFTDRSANLGDCSQPCRWKFNLNSNHKYQITNNKPNRNSQNAEQIENLFLEETQRPGQFFPIEEDDHGTYIMNSKDLCLIEHLQKLKQAGVTSFKIEGRAKSIYYLGNTIHAYRVAIDKPRTDKIKLQAELTKAPNRGFTTGFVFGEEKVEHRFDSSQAEQEWEFCGEVLQNFTKTKRRGNSKNKEFTKITDNIKTRVLKVLVHNSIKVGDVVELVVPLGSVETFKIKELYNDAGEKIEEAHGGQEQVIYIPNNVVFPEKTLLRRKIVS